MVARHLIVVSAIALTLAACSDAAPAANATPDRLVEAKAAPTAAPPQTLPTTAARDWSGDYRRQGVTAKIKRSSGAGQYEVEILDANGGGGLGTGTVKGAALIAVIPNGNTADGWKECRVTFRQSPTGMQVSGNGDCTGLLGSGSTLNGTYAYPGAAATTSSAIDRKAMFGAWVNVETGCETDTGLFLQLDDTWHRNAHYGSWSLKGNALNLVTTTLEDEIGMHPVNPPTTEHYTVRSVAEKRMTLVTPEGEAENYMKC